MASGDDTISRLQAWDSSEKAEFDSLRRQLSRKQKETSELLEEESHLLSEIARWKQKRSAGKAKVDQLEEDHKHMTLRLARLQAETEQRMRLTYYMKKAKKSIDALKVRCKERIDNAKNKRFQDIELKLEDLASLKDRVASIQEQRTEILNLGGETIESLKSECDKLASQKEEIKRKNDEQELRLTSMALKLKGTEDLIAKSTSEKSEIEEAMGALRQSLTNLEDETASYKGELQKKIDATAEYSKKTRENLQATENETCEIDVGKDRNSSLKSLTNSIASGVAKLDEFHVRKSEKVNLMSGQFVDMDKLKEEISVMDQNFKSDMDLCNHLVKEVERLKIEQKKRETKENSLKATLEAKQLELATILQKRDETKDCKSDIDEIEKALQNITLEKTDLESEFSKQDESYRLFVLDVTSLESQKATLKIEILHFQDIHAERVKKWEQFSKLSEAWNKLVKDRDEKRLLLETKRKEICEAETRGKVASEKETLKQKELVSQANVDLNQTEKRYNVAKKCLVELSDQIVAIEKKIQAKKQAIQDVFVKTGAAAKRAGKKPHPEESNKKKARKQRTLVSPGPMTLGPCPTEASTSQKNGKAKAKSVKVSANDGLAQMSDANGRRRSGRKKTLFNPETLLDSPVKTPVKKSDAASKTRPASRALGQKKKRIRFENSDDDDPYFGF